MVKLWQKLEVESIPEGSGVYGFRLNGEWLYIGKALNLRKRLTSPRHRAFQIAVDLNAELFYQSHPQNKAKGVESRYIKELEPSWNGSTSFHPRMPDTTGCPTMGNRVTPLGPVCDNELKSDRLKAQSRVHEAIAQWRKHSSPGGD